MDTFDLNILSTEGTFYEGLCDSLVIPTAHGQYGILANHSDMIASVTAGTLTYRIPGEAVRFVKVSEGYVKIENGKVCVMVELAINPEDALKNLERLAADRQKEQTLQSQSVQQHRPV